MKNGNWDVEKTPVATTPRRECQTIDKVGQLLWMWFSCPRKSGDKMI